MQIMQCCFYIMVALSDGILTRFSMICVVILLLRNAFYFDNAHRITSKHLITALYSCYNKRCGMCSPAY